MVAAEGKLWNDSESNAGTKVRSIRDLAELSRRSASMTRWDTRCPLQGNQERASSNPAKFATNFEPKKQFFAKRPRGLRFCNQMASNCLGVSMRPIAVKHLRRRIQPGAWHATAAGRWRRRSAENASGRPSAGDTTWPAAGLGDPVRPWYLKSIGTFGSY